VTCLSGERLAAYWLGELDEADAAAVEEHVFACDACSAAWSKTSSVIAGVRALPPPVLTAAGLRELRASTPSLRQVAVPPGGSATVEFGADNDVFVLQLQADLARAERVDLSVAPPDGATLLEVPHAPFDAESGTVNVLCHRHIARPGLHVHMRLRVLRDGEWSESAQYSVDHVFTV
jgi:hypothetical protein